jgi:hypothetical protein
MIKAFALAIYLLASGQVSQEESEKLAENIALAAEVHHEDPPTLIAFGKHESNFDHSQRSAAGAVGLLQLMPRWWGRFRDVRAHIIHGAYVLHVYRQKCGSQLRTIIGYRSGRCSAPPRSLTFRRALATHRQAQVIRRGLLDTRKPLRYVPMPKR